MAKLFWIAEPPIPQDYKVQKGQRPIEQVLSRAQAVRLSEPAYSASGEESCPMEVRKVIDDLRFSLEHITAEDELLRGITDQLIALRQSFPSHRALFTPSDIDFLKSLTVISDHLRAFIALKEELPSVDSLQEYMEIVSRLTHVKDALGDFPVARRVGKEIRELTERLPAIREEGSSTKVPAQCTDSRLGAEPPPLSTQSPDGH